MFAIIQAAGWPIWFLLVASLLALTLIVERTLYLRRNRILPPTLLQEVIRVYQGGKINHEVIDNLAANSPLRTLNPYAHGVGWRQHRLFFENNQQIGP